MESSDIVTSNKPLPPTDDHLSSKPMEQVGALGSAAFQAKYAGRDVAAGLITGTMAVPLSVGIAIMSDYPIKVGLATVAFACFIGLIQALIQPIKHAKATVANPTLMG